MAQKCLQMAPDGAVYGFRALIPYIRTRPYQRNAELKAKRQHQQGGQSGALGALLRRFPDIEDDLVKCIRQDRKLKRIPRSEEHTSELQSPMRISYAVLCLKKKKQHHSYHTDN